MLQINLQEQQAKMVVQQLNFALKKYNNKKQHKIYQK